MNCDPKSDKDYEQRPLTIIVLKGDEQNCTNRWAVISQNIDPEVDAILSLSGSSEAIDGEFTGMFKVVEKQIVTEVGRSTLCEYRDVVRLLIVKKLTRRDTLNVSPFHPGFDILF